MDYDSTLRSFRIDLITGEPNPIIKWFDSIWDQLTMLEVGIYHTSGGEFIYYIPGEVNKSMFLRDDSMGKFWCNHGDYWEIFGDEREMYTYSEIQIITRALMEIKLNCKVALPQPINFEKWGVYDGLWGNDLSNVVI